MREIKFRGQRTDTKEWVYGHYYFGRRQDTSCINSTCIMTDGFIFEVIPETVGQYTGLKDKNGKECYFDDLVKWGKSTYQVIWDSDEGVAWLRKISGEEAWSKLRIHLVKEGEIVGNIHETP